MNEKIGESVDAARALASIHRTFGRSAQVHRIARDIPERTYVALLQAIEPCLYQLDNDSVGVVARFLYAGCIRFDRWIGAQPWLIDSAARINFQRFLDALILCQPDSTNTAYFQVSALQWDLFTAIDRKPLAAAADDIDLLADLEARLNTIASPPQSSGHFDQFMTFSGEFRKLLRAIHSGNLKTEVTATIPIVPFGANTVITTTWNGISIVIKLFPEQLPPTNTFVMPVSDNVSTPLAPTGWQVGYTKIEVLFEALLDPGVGAPPLTALQDEDNPIEAWPAIFVDVFEILDSVIWSARQLGESHGDTFLSPNGVGPVKWTLTDGGEYFGLQFRGPPGQVWQLGGSPLEPKELRIEDCAPVSWTIRCRILAAHYLALGETNEALFWLNVGVEALFSGRVEKACAAAGINIKELSSGRSYYSNAEEVIVQQFPELAGRIQWPETAEGHPSWYVKIRYLGKVLRLGVSVKEVLRHYSVLQRHRNALFHGAREGRLAATEVKIAMESFDWIVDNFVV